MDPKAGGRTLRIGIIGCGYIAPRYLNTLDDHPGLDLVGVADSDVARAQRLAERHGVAAHSSAASLLADPTIELVVNLTDPESHHRVSEAALLAGKHVYSEKPLATDLEAATGLVDLAEARGLHLSGAPSTLLGETAQTLRRAVDGGAVGKVRVVYAELDDNPIHLMRPEGWTNELGTPWPYVDEYRTGCTVEHAGYYLSWLAALFGPARRVTAFSACLVPEKMAGDATGSDTPDFSVACITFASGVVARLTCSIVGPYDHRIRIVGDDGILSTDECWNRSAPVHLERFSQLTLNARKARGVRTGFLLPRLLGVGGRRVPLVGERKKRVRKGTGGPGGPLRSLVAEIRRRQMIDIDFLAGVAAMAQAIEGGGDQALPARFVLHVNELTLAIQAARDSAAPYAMTTTFEPLPRPEGKEHDYAFDLRHPPRSVVLTDQLIAALHRH